MRFPKDVNQNKDSKRIGERQNMFYIESWNIVFNVWTDHKIRYNEYSHALYQYVIIEYM